MTFVKPLDEECTWHLKDHRGGVLAAVDDEGKGRRGAIGGFLGGLEVVEKSEKADVLGVTSYLPYGELRQSPGKRAVEGFTGQRRDDETGLDNFNARVYDSSFCRFLQPDPKIDPNNINGYAYCAGNPVMWNDPTGTNVYNFDVAGIPLAFDPMYIIPLYMPLKQAVTDIQTYKKLGPEGICTELPWYRAYAPTMVSGVIVLADFWLAGEAYEVVNQMLEKARRDRQWSGLLTETEEEWRSARTTLRNDHANDGNLTNQQAKEDFLIRISTVPI